MSVTVLGSANLDFVYTVERIPSPGETVLATASTSVPGGKGNNQATAVARAGSQTAFISALGTDDAGDRLAASLAEDGIELHLRRLDAPTGTAIITVDRQAENAIVVDSGANGLLVGLTAGEREVVAAAGLLLLQLETPLATVTEAALVAQRAGTTVVLNAAPIRSLPPELLMAVDVLIVNEHEAAHLAADVHGTFRAVGDAAGEISEVALAQLLCGLGMSVIITLGAHGAMVSVPGQLPRHVAGIKVDAVDTTGAGDTFCGALIAELDRSTASNVASDLEALIGAATFATAAAALSVQRAGAVPSIPTFKEIHDFSSNRLSS